MDNILAMTVHTGGTAVKYYYVKDHLGSVQAIVDSSGDIVESYEYDAFGNVLGVFDASGTPIENQQSQINNRFLWQGREYSWNTRLYYFRARWYDPVTGRWLSKDPIGISGGLNQYVFCGNNSVNFIDPFGQCVEKTSEVRTHSLSLVSFSSMIVIAGGIEVGVMGDSNWTAGLYVRFSGGVGVGAGIDSQVVKWMLRAINTIPSSPGSIRDQRGVSDWYAKAHFLGGVKQNLQTLETKPSLSLEVGGGVMRDNTFVIPIINRRRGQ